MKVHFQNYVWPANAGVHSLKERGISAQRQKTNNKKYTQTQKMILGFSVFGGTDWGLGAF